MAGKKTQMLNFVFVAFFLQIFSIHACDIQLAPALYVFGDSTVDSGNNNNLPTKARGNVLPYGIDFNNTPTGRFSNGLTLADYISTFVGLPLVPAYTSLSETRRSKISTGFNYASASCGILPETGSSEGTCLTLDKQMALFEGTVKEGLPVENLKTHLAKSVFFISIGANDYTFEYFMNNDKNKPSPDAFAKFLVHELAKHIQRLYELGARKFLLNGIGPVGCTPAFRATNKGNCVEPINQVLSLYNLELSSKLLELRSQLPNSFFTHFDNQKMLDNLQKYGITEIKKACLNENQPLCSDRDKFLFFDAFHSTQAANKVYATKCFNESSMCTPLNILELVSA